MTRKRRPELKVRPGVTFIFGQTYAGKSTLLRHLLTERPHGRSLVFDPSMTEAFDALPELRTRQEAAAFLTSNRSRGSWLRVVRFESPTDYIWLAGTARYWRGVTWVLDDARALLQWDPIKTAAVLVAISGRHYGERTGVDLWVTAHRPYHVPPDLRAVVNALYSFRVVEPRDLDLIQDWCGPRFAMQVAELGPFKWAHWPPPLAVTRGGKAPSQTAGIRRVGT